MGLSPWNRSSSSVSVLDSPTPNTRRKRDSMCMRPSACAARARAGARTCPSSRAADRAARPRPCRRARRCSPARCRTALGMMIAPAGEVGLLVVVFGHLAAEAAHARRARLRGSFASSSIGRPKNSPTISLVRSSSVGPSPPVVMTMSERDSASRERLLDARGVVAHRRVAVQRHAQLRQPARDVLRVGVGDLPHQKLGAHGKYFCNHDGLPPIRCPRIGPEPAKAVLRPLRKRGRVRCGAPPKPRRPKADFSFRITAPSDFSSWTP